MTQILDEGAYPFVDLVGPLDCIGFVDLLDRGSERGIDPFVEVGRVPLPLAAVFRIREDDDTFLG